MAKIRHIAIRATDPLATAEFYRTTFDLEHVSYVDDSDPARGIYLSDGTVCLAILRPASEFVGIEHFGFLVEDAEKASHELEERGFPSMPHPVKPSELSFVEIKHKGPDGVVFDLADIPWPGSVGLDG